MNKEYEHEIAISFADAETDTSIAAIISKSLRREGISYYNYKEHLSESLGDNRLRITIEKYYNQSRYALLLISDNYIKGKTTKLECDVAQAVRREKDNFIIPVQLSSPWVTIHGISKESIFHDWKNDADILVQKLKGKIETAKQSYEGEEIFDTPIKKKPSSSESELTRESKQLRAEGLTRDQIVEILYKKYNVDKDSIRRFI